MTPSRIDISKKYAVAYIHVFGKDIDDAMLDQLLVAHDFLLKHNNMLFLLALYETTTVEKEKILTRFITHFNFPQSFHRFMSLLMDNKHISILASVLRDIYCFYKKKMGIEDLELSSSSELSADAHATLEQFFTDLSDKKYRVKKTEDPELIAGIRMQSDTLLWEHSVAKKMKKLRFELLKKV